jgi:hypothetical protein
MKRSVVTKIIYKKTQELREGTLTTSGHQGPHRNEKANTVNYVHQDIYRRADSHMRAHINGQWLQAGVHDPPPLAEGRRAPAAPPHAAPY